MSGENATSAMEKTLGHAAYEGLNAATGHDAMPWGDLTKDARTAWDAAAAAVLNADRARSRTKIQYGAMSLRARALVVLYEAACDNPNVHKSSMEALYAARAILEQSDEVLQHIALNDAVTAQLAAWLKAARDPVAEAAPPEAT